MTPDVDAVVLKALAKNPLNRYQSAAEMRADVLRAAAGRPVYAEPVLPESATATQTARVGPPGPRTGVQARVGDRRRRRTSGWAIAALASLSAVAPPLGLAMASGTALLGSVTSALRSPHTTLTW